MNARKSGIVIEADKYIGMTLGKAKQVAMNMQKRGMTTKIVNRPFGRFSVQVSFKKNAPL